MISSTADDPRHRQIARDTLLRFKTGAITFDELETEWPQSRDTAVRAISARLWHVFYGDLGSRQVAIKALAADELRLLDRCIDFLGTELPYRWPMEGSSVMDKLKRMWSDIQPPPPKDENALHGEPDAWPFNRSSEIEAAHALAR